MKICVFASFDLLTSSCLFNPLLGNMTMFSYLSSTLFQVRHFSPTWLLLIFGLLWCDLGFDVVNKHDSCYTKHGTQSQECLPLFTNYFFSLGFFPFYEHMEHSCFWWLLVTLLCCRYPVVWWLPFVTSYCPLLFPSGKIVFLGVP